MNIILNIATHGNETIGHKVAEKLKRVKLQSGTLKVQVANPLAYKKRKRFIDQDLNRSFPGNSNGNYERKIAAKLLPIIKSADVVIDIHSTTSGLKDALIVTKADKKTLACVKAINPKYVLLMSFTKTHALISNAKVGIAFEYGADKDQKTINKTVLGIKKLLAHLGALPKQAFKNNDKETILFEVRESVNKPEKSKLKSSVKNYSLIKKGAVYAYDSQNQDIKAKRDFYPILFGEKNYKDYFGFASYKKSIIR
jgi:succinylglutamate desuccinylase